MSTKHHIPDQFAAGQAERKLEELLHLLRNERLDHHELSRLQHRFNDACQELQATTPEAAADSPLLVGAKTATVKEEISVRRRLPRTFRAIVSVLMISLGFSMIILPTSSSFEIYTIFLFNEQDGFTLMDLISLVIVFTGIYGLVTSFYRRNRVY